MTLFIISLQGLPATTTAATLAIVGLWLVVVPFGSRNRVLEAVPRSEHRPQRSIIAMVKALLPVSRTAIAAESAEWVVWIRQLAALLQVGRTSASAFSVAAQSLAQSPHRTATGQRIEAVSTTVAHASVIGKTPSATLRSLAHTPVSAASALRRIESKVLSDLSTCWEVSERTGAPLAALLEGLAEATEADLDAQAARETALAGSRATVRILSWLPVLALGLGVLIGADPVRTLLTTPWGIAAGAAGAVLTIVGRMWTGHLVHRAESVTEQSGESSRARLGARAQQVRA